MIDEVVAALRAQIVPSGLEAFYFHRFDPEGFNGSQVRQAAEMLPGPTGRRLILVRDLHLVPAQQLIPLEDYLDRPLETTCLVIIVPDPDGRKKIFTKLARTAAVWPCPHPTEHEARSWVRSRLTAAGVPATEDLVAGLLGRTGPDLVRLAGEIEKLRLLKDQATDAIEQIVAGRLEATLRELTARLAETDAPESLRLVQVLLEDEPALKILGWIAAQVRREIERSGVTPQGAERLGACLDADSLLKLGKSEEEVLGALVLDWCDVPASPRARWLERALTRPEN